MRWLAFIVCLLASQAALAQSPALPGFPPGAILGRGAIDAASLSYTGPCDVSGVTCAAYVGVRAANASYATGSNHAINAYNGSSTFTINILTTGQIDAATATTDCTSPTCTVSQGDDQTGNGQTFVQGTTTAQPALVLNSGCFSPTNMVSFSFNPSNSQVLQNFTGTLASHNFTFWAWLYTTSLASLQSILGSNTTGLPEIRVNTDGTLTLLKQSAVNIGSSSGSLSINTPTFIAVNYNDTTGAYAFYINGSASGSGTNQTTMTIAGAVYLGSSPPDGGFNGGICEAGWVQSVLTPTQVSNLYSIPLP